MTTSTKNKNKKEFTRIIKKKIKKKTRNELENCKKKTPKTLYNKK